jgi:toxin-antitoxin system PIN domain toxin
VTAHLLDVNVLIALVDPAHVHHEPAHRWFAAQGRTAWATCPMTENGLVRVLSQPTYPNRPGDAPAVLAILGQICASEGHEFWPDDVSLREIVQPGAIVTHRQVTNIYLLGLAARHGGRLATFDGRIPTTAVRGGARALELIPA